MVDVFIATPQLFKMTILLRGHAALLADRYSKRKEREEESKIRAQARQQFRRAKYDGPPLS